MPYNNLMSRTDIQALIPENVSNLMLQNLENQAAALNLFTRLPVSTNQTRFPVLSALPTAYFVNGDTGLKQTTEVNWDNQYINIEELATIVPIPEAVLDDAGFDVWGSVRPLVEQAIARALDAAVFFGTNKPASWPGAVVPEAVAAGNVVARGTNAAGAGGLAADISDLFATIEADGYVVTGAIANQAYRGRIRNARGTDGQPLMDMQGDIYGVAPTYPMRGLWPTGLSAAELIAGDFTAGILGIRQDFTYKLLTEAVITDNLGAVVYNLPQQDLVALRVVFRVGFAMGNPINYDQPTATARYPFGVLRSPAA